MPRQLHLAVAVYGVGGPGQHGLWKDPRVPKNASIDINYYIKTAQVAEQALFDALFIVDSQFINPTYPSHYLNRLEPLTLLSAVATHTASIGLVATASSTYNSPFNLARRLASLDHISGGRAGWNVVTSFDTSTSRNYGLDEHLDYATRYGRALEAVQVIRGLWDSYEDDAFVADVERNVFLDPAKLHALDHVGEHFKVAGRSTCPGRGRASRSSSRPGCRKTAATWPPTSPRASTRPAARSTRRRPTTATSRRRAAALGRDPTTS